jgi:hypothetical protein
MKAEDFLTSSQGQANKGMMATDFLKGTSASDNAPKAVDFLSSDKTALGEKASQIAQKNFAFEDDTVAPSKPEKESDKITLGSVADFFTGHFPQDKDTSLPEVEMTDKGAKVNLPETAEMPFLQDPITSAAFGGAAGLRAAKPLAGKMIVAGKEAVGWLTGGLSEVPKMVKGAGESVLKGITEKNQAERLAKLREVGKDVPIKAEEFLTKNIPSSAAKPVAELGEAKTPIKNTAEEVTLQSTVIPGAKEFLEPASQTVARTFRSAADDIKRTFAPLTMGKEAKETGAIMREKLSDMARRGDAAEESLKQARKAFNGMEPEAKVSFMDNIEKGIAQEDKVLTPAAETIRNILDSRRDQIRKLGTGKLEKFDENYFPHIWQDTKKATEVMHEWFARTPLEGKKSFLKKRTVPTIQDGLDRGLNLVSDNPVDLVILKAREMDKYIMAHETLNEMKNTGLTKFVRSGVRPPEGWVEINDKIAKVYVSTEKYGRFVNEESITRDINHINKIIKETSKTETTGGVAGSKADALIEDRVLEALRARGWSEGETQQILSRIKAAPAGGEKTITIDKTTESIINTMVTHRIEKGFIPGKGFVNTGNYYAPENAAAIINNYLKPGLRNKEWFRGYLGLANIMNQAQLGLSAFHLGFTSMDASISKVALGLNQLLGGSPVSGIKSIISSPAAPLTTVMKGNKVLKEWFAPGSQGAEIGQIVDALRMGGGRVRMDSFYQTRISEKMMDSFRSGNIVGGILRLPFAAVEQAARPIMEQLVPRQKLGVFMDIAKWELEKLEAKGASRAEIRETMQKAWDSVDNRMGQLVYDNLFWQRTTKDLGMASVRSLGWNLGTFRELGGGAIDLTRQIGKVFKGQRPEMTYRMAYTMALPIVTGTMGGITNYLMTGEYPKDLKDYFFPRTGRIDKDGNAERISFPSYIKDIYHYADTPGKAIVNKLHPALGTLGDMLRNEDYYGTEIRNADDPIMKQALDELKHIGKQNLPFSVQGAMKRKESGVGLAGQALPFIGVLPAPKYITRTEIQNEIFSTLEKRKGHPTRSQQAFEAGQSKQEISQAYQEGDQDKFWDKVKDSVQKGHIKNSMATLKTLVANADLPSDIKAFKNLPEQDQERILAKMNKSEVTKFAWYAHKDIIAHIGDLSDSASEFVRDFKNGKVKKPIYHAGKIVEPEIKTQGKWKEIE